MIWLLYFVIIIFIYLFLRVILCDFKKIQAVSLKKAPLKIVLITKNNEKTIEGIIRSTIKELEGMKFHHPIPQIFVYDLASEDDTPYILRKLSAEYDFVQILTLQD